MKTEVEKKTFPFWRYVIFMLIAQMLLCVAAVVLKLPYLCHMDIAPAVSVMAASTIINTLLLSVAICTEKKKRLLYAAGASFIPVEVLLAVGGAVRSQKPIVGVIALAFLIAVTGLYVFVCKRSYMPVDPEERNTYLFLDSLRFFIFCFMASAFFYISFSYDDAMFVKTSYISSDSAAQVQTYSMADYKADIEKYGGLIDFDGVTHYSIDDCSRIEILQKIANQTAREFGCNNTPRVASALLYDPLCNGKYPCIYYDIKHNVIYLAQGLSLNEGDLRNTIYMVSLKSLVKDKNKDIINIDYFDKTIDDYARSKAAQYRAVIDNMRKSATGKAV